jgi:folate-dependent phosphoribosylglycinamide formyltransferase PurN
MSIVLVTGDGPEHHYVANRITATCDVAAILVCKDQRRRSWQSVWRTSRAQFIDKACGKLYLALTGDAARREQSLRRVLGPSSVAFERADLRAEVGRPKDGALARRLAELRPDIIAVYGTGMIPDAALAAARVVALNMHTGLSPWYRGVACALWPILDGRPEMVGATVHECTANVDGGRIFRRRRAVLYRGDDIHAVFARAVEVGAEAYVEVIGEALAGRLAGEPQDLRAGREYRGSMLGFRAEWQARRSLRRLAPKFPERASGSPTQTALPVEP